jgi:hypothetical protein
MGTAEFRIFNVMSGMVTIANLTLTNGRIFTGIAGGGAILNAATLTVRGCTFYGNTAGTFPGGGAIFNSGTLAIIDSTFNRNDYAAMENASSGTVTMTASTVSGNGGPVGGAGGIYNNNGGTFRVRNSIIAGNEGGYLDVTGSFISDGYNFIGAADASTGFGGSGSHDQVGTSASPANPNIGPLQDNGGPTLTMIPLRVAWLSIREIALVSASSSADLFGPLIIPGSQMLPAVTPQTLVQ